ncbi:hypothetical protein AOQ72_04140 [Bradyrhizobium yuanmingense]|uniref:Uncharacterized protein n=1 Tax=Bradyrhizobium yuanmingense TaxID=108015 RepID=A0A0R3BKH7_9BRAD|nr:hypothetical protein [Bradyrhizobium yuanmingense]KRP85839.1 hypothetical protein AOQ72_04140 [Bradyrhizobium yuanmingense]
MNGVIFAAAGPARGSIRFKGRSITMCAAAHAKQVSTSRWFRGPAKSTVLAKPAIKVMPVIAPRVRPALARAFPQSLARLDTGGAPLVSLYLQLPPERRVGRAWHSVFCALIHTIPQTADRPLRARG